MRFWLYTLTWLPRTRHSEIANISKLLFRCMDALEIYVRQIRTDLSQSAAPFLVFMGA